MKYEIDMVNNAIEYYRGFGYKVSTEVPFLHRSIDLVYENNGELNSIEFKRQDWKRAFEQARTHIYGSNKVYICILKPMKGVSQELHECFQDSPIGLLFYDETNQNSLIEEIYPASSEHTKWDIGQQWLKKAFNKRFEEELCQQH